MKRQPLERVAYTILTLAASGLWKAKPENDPTQNKPPFQTCPPEASVVLPLYASAEKTTVLKSLGSKKVENH